jgi:hypothetical protein
MRRSAARTFAGNSLDGMMVARRAAWMAKASRAFAKLLLESTAGTRSSPNAGYFQVRATVKSGLDCDGALVRRPFVC